MDSKPRILNLDGDVAARYLKTRRLQEAGFDVIEAGTGADALRIAREQPIDIALLDVKLPDISGLEVCRQMKANPFTSDVPIVQISATHVSESDQAASFAQGANIYLTEPVEAIEMVTVVRTLLRLRESESGLLASEERYRAIVSQATAGIAQKDLGGRLLQVNQRYCEIVGRTAEELQHLTLVDITHPDDVARNLQMFRQMVGDGQPFHIDKRYLRPDGSVVWASNAVSLVRDKMGVAQNAIEIVIDITERKSTEERDRLMSRVSERLSGLTDPPSTLQKITGVVVPAFADWCAVDLVAADGVHKRVASTHVVPGTKDLSHRLGSWTDTESGDLHIVAEVVNCRRAELIKNLDEAEAGKRAGDDTRLDALREFGIKSYICIPLMSRETFLGALAMGITTSRPRYGEAELATAIELGRRVSAAVENANLYSAIRESAARKDEFLATLAHELRNPLAPLANSLNIMRSARDDSQLTAQARGVMERQVAQLRRLVDDLLDVSRFNTGKLELRKERISLASVINNAVEATRAGIEVRHGFSVSLPEEDVMLYVDPARFAQVITNLLDNASKYTPPGGRISLAAERHGDEIRIKVSDTGIGISREMLTKIFEMFTQVENSLDRTHGGLGIGLTLVKRLVEMHGGKIDAYSTGLGRGSTFILRIPVVIQSAALPGKPDAAGANAAEGASSRRRILVVDDNVDAANSLRILLELMGHDVDLAHDGPHALQIVSEIRPDLVFLDIGLPTMTGYEVARRLRGSGHAEGVMLVALSGYGTSNDISRSTEAGFDAHFVKPIDIDNLNRILARHPQQQPG